MQTFDWNSEDKWNEFFHVAFEHAIRPPIVPINASCGPPAVDPHIDCSRNKAFTGERHSDPIRMGHAIQLGFDADTLEIHLNELADVVDVFFIIEWTMLHNRQNVQRKRLTWEAIKDQTRFKKFQSQVVHLILDDLDKAHVLNRHKTTTTTTTTTPDLFLIERQQEYLRWKKIHEWNAETQFFKSRDLIGFGDADEIASRANLQRLKQCVLKSTVRSIDIGIWFPYGWMNQAFRTDFPVANQPYSLGDPTYWVFEAAEAFKTTPQHFPNRERGTSGESLVGGIHMTHYGYLPFQILKRMSCTECNVVELQELERQLRQTSRTREWAQMEHTFHLVPQDLTSRIVQLSELSHKDQQVVHYPWFYTCNPKRYPTWTDGLDPRTYASH